MCICREGRADNYEQTIAALRVRRDRAWPNTLNPLSHSPPPMSWKIMHSSSQAQVNSVDIREIRHRGNVSAGHLFGPVPL